MVGCGHEKDVPICCRVARLCPLLRSVWCHPMQLRAKCEQLAVRSARHEALHADLSEAQAQLAAQCARLQVKPNPPHLCHTVYDVLGT